MTVVDAVLFDLDDTICVYERSADEVLSVAFDEAGVDPFFSGEEYIARFEEFVDADETIEPIREACFAAFAEESGLDSAVGRDVARAYAVERDQRAVEFLPGAERALETLSEQYPLGLVTNGDPELQGPKLESLGIAGRFETVVHGGVDAPYKPDPEPFNLALDALGVDPNCAVHVGNSLESDVAGAHAAGLRSVWMRRNAVDVLRRRNREIDVGRFQLTKKGQLRLVHRPEITDAGLTMDTAALKSTVARMVRTLDGAWREIQEAAGAGAPDPDTLFGSVWRLMTKSGWKPKRAEEKTEATVRFRGSGGPVLLQAVVKEQQGQVQLFATVPGRVPDDKRSDALKQLQQLNRKASGGLFLLSPDGQVRFQTIKIVQGDTLDMSASEFKSLGTKLVRTMNGARGRFDPLIEQ
jgi:putative hydrolase of the HAD superfamily